MSTPENKSNPKLVIIKKGLKSPDSAPNPQSETTLKDNRGQSLWLSEMLKLHKFMAKLIADHPTDTDRVMCLICTENNKPNKEGTKEIVACKRSWLKQHFQSPTHNNYITNLEQKIFMTEIVDKMGRKKDEEETEAELEESKILR